MTAYRKASLSLVLLHDLLNSFTTNSYTGVESNVLKLRYFVLT